MHKAGIWAGYSPASGHYWVGNEIFDTAKEAARKMASFGLNSWLVINACIDDDDQKL